MTLSEELTARGFINQFSAENLTDILEGEPRTVYHGIDPSADSAHAGNFIVWILLRHLANRGHKIIFLVGGGTGMIGDPKPDAERTLRPQSETDANVEKIRTQAERIVGGDTPVEFVNNQDWLLSLGLIPFLRDIGKHFTINELIKKEAIAKRLTSEQGISYTEFAYPLLQAYDYLTLYRQYGCTLQVGGSDQWGNIVAGVDLIRRLEQATAHALTVPLIVDKTTGKKFGKSEGNAVWLDPEKTSPYTFYQFWFNVTDENVIDYLKLFTFVSLEEIATLEQEFAANPGSREAQKRLAYEVTALVHSAATAEAVANVSASLFGEVALPDLTVDERALLKEQAPCTMAADGSLVVDVLVSAGLASSKREARTFIESGAVQLGGTKVTDVTTTLEAATHGTLCLLKRGKKQLALVEIQ